MINHLLHFIISIASLGFFASSSEEFSHLLLFNLNYVFIHQLLIHSTFLRRELAAATPDISKAELCQKVFVNLHDSSFDTGSMSTCSKNERVVKNRHLSLPFSVYSDKAKLIPNLVNEDVNSEFFFDGDASDLRVF